MRKVILASAGLAAIALVAVGAPYASAETKEPSYNSSVKVDGKRHGGEGQEAVRYAALAKIDAAQAGSAAQAKVPGRILGTALENENGNLIFSVAIQPSQSGAPVQEVKIDAGNGSILAVQADTGHEDGTDDGEEDDD
jgi:uncharacterized membrane protein YkoI